MRRFCFDVLGFRSFISLLWAVVQRIEFVCVTYVREVCEDGSLSVRIELDIPLCSPGGCGFSIIFWGCDGSGSRLLFFCRTCMVSLLMTIVT
jgi:hypothetical protein